MLKQDDKRKLTERIKAIELGCAEIRGIATVLASGASGTRTAQTLISGVARVRVGACNIATIICHSDYNADWRVYDTPVSEGMTALSNDIAAVIKTACERENDVVDAICRGAEACAVDSMEIKGLRHVMHIARGMMTEYAKVHDVVSRYIVMGDA